MPAGALCKVLTQHAYMYIGNEYELFCSATNHWADERGAKSCRFVAFLRFF